MIKVEEIAEKYKGYEVDELVEVYMPLLKAINKQCKELGWI